jgi:hypothetical protein
MTTDVKTIVDHKSLRPTDFEQLSMNLLLQKNLTLCQFRPPSTSSLASTVDHLAGLGRSLSAKRSGKATGTKPNRWHCKSPLLFRCPSLGIQAET